jgi:hypothetical protein
MSSKFSLWSSNRETTSEYNVNELSKNNGKKTKTVSKLKTPERFSPLTLKKPQTKTTTSPPTKEAISETNEQSHITFSPGNNTQVPNSTFASEPNTPQIDIDMHSENTGSVFSQDSTSPLEGSTSSPLPNNILNQNFTYQQDPKEIIPLQDSETTTSSNNTLKPRKIIIEQEQVPGNNNQEKILYLKNKFEHLLSLLYIRTEYPIGTPLFAAIFGNHQNGKT